ncbi:VOC family protein [Bacillus sp. FJAT-49736]|uniref:VOC family protein n=1 Tax=Bacillus sp. FJAT-49736 TaxID=2833582 RepID=UPI001BCA28E1|nr:VOC family protein [Bacillus sp. FJAT-49736]MBS4172762.1 VOC family protein [Bacillus sp. FJAT-49736]
MVIGIYPYLVTNGNGQEAVKFYQDAFDAEVLDLKTFGDMPDNPEHPTPAEAKNLVLNAHLKIGNSDFMISDTFPGQPHKIGDHVTIAVTISTVEKSQEVFEKLQQGGNVIMPLQQTFWSPSYGQVVDKYGVTWQVSTQG